MAFSRTHSIRLRHLRTLCANVLNDYENSSYFAAVQCISVNFACLMGLGANVLGARNFVYRSAVRPAPWTPLIRYQRISKAYQPQGEFLSSWPKSTRAARELRLSRQAEFKAKARLAPFASDVPQELQHTSAEIALRTRYNVGRASRWSTRLVLQRANLVVPDFSSSRDSYRLAGSETGGNHVTGFIRPLRSSQARTRFYPVCHPSRCQPAQA